MGIREDAFERFDELMRDDGDFTLKLPVGDGHKYVIFSDLHLGNGKKTDRFSRNVETMIGALKFYRQKGYGVILNGDIDDYHKYDSDVIRKAYGGTLFKELKAFDRFFRIFGNHDIEWSLVDPIALSCKSAFEAVKLGDHIIVVHGHQAEEWYEKDLQIVRMGTTLNRVKESIFGSLGSSYSFTQLPGKKDKIFADWAKDRRKIFIGGHTHRPVFASQSIYDWTEIKIKLLDREISAAQEAGDKDKVKALKKRRLWFRNRRRFVEKKIKTNNIRRIHLGADDPFYFNCGGGIFSDGMTNLEIEGKIIRMAYWDNKTKERENIWGDFDMATKVPI